jgi:hypothetical protein
MLKKLGINNWKKAAQVKRRWRRLLAEATLTSLLYILPLGSRYSPQHPVLKHLQSVFFP